MQDLEAKSIKEFDAVLKSLLIQLPETRKELNIKIAEIGNKETAENRAEAIAIREVQRYADEIADKLEGIG